LQQALICITMNDQLLSHLETFDSDEQFSENAELVAEEESVWPFFRETMLNLKSMSRRIARPESWREAVVKCFWLLPIGILLGDYIGLLMSFSFSLIGLLVSMVRPEPHHYHEEMTGHEDTIHVREISFADRRSDTEAHPVSKKQMQDCRKEVSRLLGIIGAPPLDWSDVLNTNDVDDQALGSSSESSTLVVNFLEAHVQFLLTIDEAYRWLQVSASLHLGLGPRSQCVERVERASIAREFRKGRRQSIDEVQDASKEPQRGLYKSVLSLSMVRQHLAKAMVDQSDSILQVWHRSQEDIGISQVISHAEPLDIPDVVDLIWVKGGRQQLAAVLSDTVNVYCTPSILAKLAVDVGIHSVMEASMSNARNAREYLLSNLLLGKRRTTTPLPNPQDPLLLSLIHYREQLDALSGAIWSCQQYADTDLPSNEHGRAEWWTRIQQFGENCRAMESEIGLHFFAVPPNGSEDEEQSTGSTAQETQETGSSQQEHQTYQREDDDWDSPSEKKMDDPKLPTKTLVFKGHGAKPERSKHSVTKKGGATEGSVVLPVRDSMSERQMIRELQNRITLMRPLEDDDEDDELETEAAKAARLGRAPAAPLFLGASGSLLSELRMTLPAPSQMGEEEQVLGE
jgi:hypothetical protein